MVSVDSDCTGVNQPGDGQERSQSTTPRFGGGATRVSRYSPALTRSTSNCSPGTMPSASRSSAGRTIWPFVEIVVFTARKIATYATGAHGWRRSCARMSSPTSASRSGPRRGRRSQRHIVQLAAVLSDRPARRRDREQDNQAEPARDRRNGQQETEVPGEDRQLVSASTREDHREGDTEVRAEGQTTQCGRSAMCPLHLPTERIAGGAGNLVATCRRLARRRSSTSARHRMYE